MSGREFESPHLQKGAVICFLLFLSLSEEKKMRKVDKRVEATKEKLKNTLIELVKDERLEDISISELCKTAGINRNTFYSHYSSVEELLEELEDEFLAQLLKQLENDMTHEFSSSIEDFLVNLLSIIKNDMAKCSLFFSENGDKEFLKRIVLTVLPSATEIWSGMFQMDAETAKLIYSFIAGGSIRIIENWVVSGCRTDISVIAKFLNNVILHGQSAFLPVNDLR